MPNYDFRCNVCQQRFSQQVAIKDKDRVCCPKCGGKVSQLFTGFLYTRKGQPDSSSSCSSCSSGSCSSCSGCH